MYIYSYPQNSWGILTTGILGQNHTPLNHLLTKERMESYKEHWIKHFKFTIVRNPYDRFVPAYHYNIKQFSEKLHEQRMKENPIGNTIRKKKKCVDLNFKQYMTARRNTGWHYHYYSKESVYNIFNRNGYQLVLQEVSDLNENNLVSVFKKEQ